MGRPFLFAWHGDTDIQDLTLVLPHFCNLGMLAEHQKAWADYSDASKSRFHVIVVDDCSPKGQRPNKKCIVLDDLASFRIYRLTTKARWNWLACRNLGVDQASTEWVLLTDIDHLMPPETCDKLLGRALDPDCVYRLARVDAYKPWPYRIADCPVRENKRYHPNTWLLTRSMFDKIGGYDERLSGCYGTDGEFRDRVQRNARAVILLPDNLVRYPREVLPDASTTIYTRKGDVGNDTDLLERRRKRDADPGWQPIRGSFPWEKVAEAGQGVHA